MDFLCFLAVFELMSDSLTTIYVEPDQCPSHHAILLTQGRICEIFTKKFWELAILKNGHFWKTAILDFFFPKNFFLLDPPWKSVTNYNYVIQWMGLNYDVFQQIPCYAYCVILRYIVYVQKTRGLCNSPLI